MLKLLAHNVVRVNSIKIVLVAKWADLTTAHQLLTK